MLIDAKGAPIYVSTYGKGKHQYFADDPIYKVIDERGGWYLVRHHSLSSGITGWFKKNDVKPYKYNGNGDGSDNGNVNINIYM